MKMLLLLLVLINWQLSISNCQPSQIKRTWHWYFGNHAGIDFSSGTAVADTNGALVTSEGCASICDTAGNLQFYSDGRTVWNRLHQVMPNGTGILGGANGSSSQQALIIPKPLSPNLYYLFTTDEAENYGANGMRYTVIDMNLDGGNGDVVITEKNILLFAPCTEKLAAVNHCNDTSVWVMGHELNNSNFRAYVLTTNGIDTTAAVISTIGFPHSGNVFAAMAGSAKFSPNGTMLCTVTDTGLKRIELFQFDNFTGILSNRITLATNHNITHAISFSSDNTKLYTGSTNQNLYQYDVNVYDSMMIMASQNIVSFNLGNGYRFMENGPDGKIYLLHYNQIDSVLSRIEFPDLNGTACNVTIYSVNLILNATLSGLPTFNESYFRTSNTSGCTTGAESLGSNNLIKIFPNLARDWIYLEGNGITSVMLMDVLGRVIIDKVTDAASLTQEIYVSGLSNGMYVLIAKAKNKTLQTKIIKQ